MTLEETKQDLLNHDKTFRYMMLSRMKQDCLYFLGNGNGCKKYLWADSVEEHIYLMKALYNSFIEKPEWLTMNEIEYFERNMLQKYKLK